LYRIKNLDTPFFRLVTNHAFARRTEFSSLDRLCIPCSAVKRVSFQSVQNMASRMMTGARRCDRTTLILEDLHNTAC